MDNFGGLGRLGGRLGGAGVLDSGLGGRGGGCNFGGNQLGNRLGNLAALNQSSGTPCILMSNLDEEKGTPNDLFILFRVYGNVRAVKILFNKKDNAPIQITDASQAQQAITYLNKAQLPGPPQTRKLVILAAEFI